MSARELVVAAALIVAWVLISFGLAVESRPLVIAAVPSLAVGTVGYLLGLRKENAERGTSIAKLKDSSR